MAKITVPVQGEGLPHISPSTDSLLSLGSAASSEVKNEVKLKPPISPMKNEDILFALGILDHQKAQSKSRDREVFSALVQLHASNHQLLSDLSTVIQIMCTLQPPEFVFVSFAVELDKFSRKSAVRKSKAMEEHKIRDEDRHQPFSIDLQFVSSFIQQMCHVLLNADEAKSLRVLLQDCIGNRDLTDEREKRRTRLFQILLHSFSHNLVASVSLCLWAGAFRTASSFLQWIDPLDINLVFLLEVDKIVELLERPLFRHLHLRMLENDRDPTTEGSGAMLFKTLKLILMVIPQSSCYRILRDRLVTISRYRQSALAQGPWVKEAAPLNDTPVFVARVLDVRRMHLMAAWENIRTESLETPTLQDYNFVLDEGADRRAWLGYDSKEDEATAKAKFQEEKRRLATSLKIEEVKDGYEDFDAMQPSDGKDFVANINERVAREESQKEEQGEEANQEEWKEFWTNPGGDDTTA